MAGLAGLVVGALGAGAVAVVVLGRDDDRAAPILTPEGVMDIQGILDKVQESVVTIETSGNPGGGVFEGAGTGIVLSEDGMVLTNEHVVRNARDIDVRMFDGSRHAASLVGSSPDDDLAVIQLEGIDHAVVAELGSSDDLQVGDPVIAIGNALNLGGQPSVTQGIVSATNRSIDSPEGAGGPIHLANLIQTDAAINRGNSGGPLVDARGQVVGINTAIIDDTQNIGFAIAIDPIEPLIEDLRNGQGEITADSAFLGVGTIDLDDVDEAVRRELGITADEGAFVSEVIEGSAADEAGIEPADVIVALGDEAVSSAADVPDIVASHEPGDEIEVTVEREGDERTFTATLGRRGD